MILKTEIILLIDKFAPSSITLEKAQDIKDDIVSMINHGIDAEELVKRNQKEIT